MVIVVRPFDCVSETLKVSSSYVFTSILGHRITPSPPKR